MALLASIRLERFRTFREETDFRLAPLTVITGPNSSGKSSVFKALLLLQRAAQATGLTRLDFAGGTHGLGSYHAALSRGERSPMVFTLSLVPSRRKKVTAYDLRGMMRILSRPLSDREREATALPPEGYKSVPQAEILPDTPVFFELSYGPPADQPLLERFRVSTGRRGEQTLCTVEIEEEEVAVGSGRGATIKDGKLVIDERPPEVIRYDKDYKYRVRIHGDWLYRQVGGSREELDDLLHITEAYPELAAEVFERLEGVLSTEFSGFGGRGGPLELAAIINKACTDWGGFESMLGHPEVDVPEKDWWESTLVRRFFYPILKMWVGELLAGLAPGQLEHTGTLRAYPQRIYLESSSSGSFTETLKAFATQGEELDLEGMREWLRTFGLGDDVRVERVVDAGYTVSLVRDGEPFALADLGYGFTQLLPLVMQTALEGRGRAPTILVEEPEASLHPNLQSKLADLFADLVAGGEQVLVETHSEYLIRRLQYLVATGQVDPRYIVIYYLGADPGAEDYVRRITIADTGQLSQEFGPGFTDEATNLMVDLYKHGSQN